MGFLGESAPPASCLGVPIGGGTRSPPEFSGSRWLNPKREFLSFSSNRGVVQQEYEEEPPEIAAIYEAELKELVQNELLHVLTLELPLHAC